MPSRKQSAGTDGENLALSLLLGKGYRLVARHVTTRWGEIDAVMEHDGTWVFVEVKSRRSARFGAPEEAVSAAKQGRMIRAALVFLQRRNETLRSLRFDVVAMDGRSVRHLTNAFSAADHFHY